MSAPVCQVSVSDLSLARKQQLGAKLAEEQVARYSDGSGSPIKIAQVPGGMGGAYWQQAQGLLCAESFGGKQEAELTLDRYQKQLKAMRNLGSMASQVTGASAAQQPVAQAALRAHEDIIGYSQPLASTLPKLLTSHPEPVCIAGL